MNSASCARRVGQAGAGDARRLGVRREHCGDTAAELAPRGDGHPVLVFPGLITGDLSTLPLRNYLQSRGYASLPLGAGNQSRATRDGVIDACLERLDRCPASTVARSA
jgi:hypothetical protein